MKIPKIVKQAIQKGKTVIAKQQGVATSPYDEHFKRQQEYIQRINNGSKGLKSLEERLERRGRAKYGSR